MHEKWPEKLKDEYVSSTLTQTRLHCSFGSEWIWWWKPSPESLGCKERLPLVWPCPWCWKNKPCSRSYFSSFGKGQLLFFLIPQRRCFHFNGDNFHVLSFSPLPNLAVFLKSYFQSYLIINNAFLTQRLPQHLGSVHHFIDFFFSLWSTSIPTVNLGKLDVVLFFLMCWKFLIPLCFLGPLFYF